MISFDININNIIGRKYSDNNTLCLSHFFPFTKPDIETSNEIIKKEIIKFIKKQKYFLKKSNYKIDKSIFLFCTEPSYNYLINEYKDFVKNNIFDELKLDVSFYLSCHKNDSINNIDYFFDYYLYDVNIDWDFLENYNPIKEKKFITLNNRKRQHRIDLKNFLIHHDILKNCFYSFNWDNDFNFNNNIINNNFKIENINQYYYLLKKITPRSIKNYFIDDDLWTNKNMIDNFKKSWFYIITERDYSSECIFPTEKIYKSFLYKLPFILIGNPGTLKFLKNKGFKTFEKYIDESYDEEIDYEKRKQKIYDELLRIN